MSSVDPFAGPIVSWLNRHAPQGVIVTDAALIIREWNAWLELNSGIPKSDVEGKHLFDVFPDLSERGLNQLYEDVLQGQVRILSHRFHGYLIPMPSPSEPQFAQMQQTAHIGPLMDGVNVIGTLTAINDVTERIARERELHEAREIAEAANKSKDRFVAMLSHDLRVPLNSVVGWVQLMKARRDDPEIRDKALKSIEQNTLVQIRMIEDLLDLTRISSGKLALDLAETEIGKVVEDALDVLKPLAAAKSIQMEPSIQLDCGLIRADSKRLQQVIWNLVSNALKFTPAGGRVDVEVTSSANGTTLLVRDTGIGLSKDTLSHIFESMWQLKQGGRESQGGLGLGLTIVQRLVELHGGSVRAESPGLGLGSTFIVELPRVAAIRSA